MSKADREQPTVPPFRRVKNFINAAFLEWEAWAGNTEDTAAHRAAVRACKAEVDAFFRHHFPGGKPRATQTEGEWPMEPETAEQERERRFAAVDFLRPHGFRPVGGWLFMKGETYYDLSAADLDQIKRIEREGLFTVEPDEARRRMHERHREYLASNDQPPPPDPDARHAAGEAGHTPGLLAAVLPYGESGGQWFLCRGDLVMARLTRGTQTTPAEREANARRLAAAWNAFAGADVSSPPIPTAAIERAGAGIVAELIAAAADVLYRIPDRDPAKKRLIEVLDKFRSE